MLCTNICKNICKSSDHMASTVTVGSASVCPSTWASTLGVYFDSQLNLKQHVSTVAIGVIHWSLPLDMLQTMPLAFITCWLDYCNSLLAGLPACYVRCLQSVQNAAGRLFVGLFRYDSVEHVLRDKLHWLPIMQRINSRSECLESRQSTDLRITTWRILHSCFKHFRIESKQIYSPGDFIVSSTTRTITYRRRSFAVASLTLWNSPSLEIRISSSLLTFRSTLKLDLFREAYNISDLNLQFEQSLTFADFLKLLFCIQNKTCYCNAPTD